MTAVYAGYRTILDLDANGELDDFSRVARFLGAGSLARYEDVTGRVRARPGIRCERGRDQIRSLAPPMAGAFDAELDNIDRVFSQENTSSALSGYLEPGIAVQQRAYYGGTEYKLWTGVLDDLPQYPEAGRWSVGIPALGSLSKLRGKTGLSSALYSGITTNTALGYILDAAGETDTAERVFSTGQTTLAWFWIDPADDLYELALAVFYSEGPGAALYEDGAGRIHFEDRHYRLTTGRSTASQATFRDAGAEPRFAVPYSYDRGIKNVVNVCQVTHKTREAQALAVLWQLGSSLSLSASESRQFVIQHESGDPFTAAVAPTSGAGDFTVSVGAVSSATLDRTSGSVATLTITAGAAGATVTGLRVRAQLVTVTYTTDVKNTIDASTSITKYGKRTYSLPTRPEIAIGTLQDFTNAVVGLYQLPRATVEITLNNGHEDRLVQALTREISDRVTIVEAQTGLNADFFVEQIAHEILEAGKLHLTRLGCEKVNTTDYAFWGTAVWGTSVWGF